MVISGLADRVVIDKTTKTITVRKVHSLFRQRVIPFSDILRIHASPNTRKKRRSKDLGNGNRLYWESNKTYWETVLELRNRKKAIINSASQQYTERLIIDESTHKSTMVYLAGEITKYLYSV